jgi:hypothetical protein
MQQSEVLRAVHAAGDENAVVRILRAYVLGVLPSERRQMADMQFDQVRSGDDVIELAGVMTAQALRGSQDDGAEGSIRSVRLVVTSASMRIVQIRKAAMR